MRLASWVLLLFYSTVVCAIEAFPNMCAGESKAGSTSLPQEIKIPSTFKVSAVFTDWKANYTMIIDEMRRDNSYIIESTTKDIRHTWSTHDQQLLHRNQSDCSTVNESTLFSLPSDIYSTFPLKISSVADIVNGIAAKNMTGFNSYVRIVAGVEGIGWFGCINVTNSSVVAVEVVYAGNEQSSVLENPPRVLSVALSHYTNLSDVNSTMTSRISLDFSPFREVLDLQSHLEIAHGRICNGLLQTVIPINFTSEIEVIYSKQISDSVLTSKLTYDTNLKVSAESVVNGKALLFNETFTNQDYLVVHDVSRGMEYVFSSSPNCSMHALDRTTNDVSPSGFQPPTYLFIPQIDSLNFSLYSNISQNKMAVLEYRAQWGTKVIEVIVHDTQLSTITIFSEGTVESISNLAVMEKTSVYGISTDIATLLRGCYNRFSKNLASFVLKGVSLDKISSSREDFVSNKIAETLVTMSKATVSPYRLSFAYIEDGDSNENTRVITRMSDAFESSNETSSSEFMTLLNATISSGIGIQISDTTRWMVSTDPMMPYPPLPPVIPPSFNGYTGGSMLVMGIFMIMLGVALGVGGVALVSRRQRLSTLAYQVFE